MVSVPLKIYLITRTDAKKEENLNIPEYGIYSVVSKDAETAISYHPNGLSYIIESTNGFCWYSHFQNVNHDKWVNSNELHLLSVQCIAIQASEELEEGQILFSAFR